MKKLFLSLAVVSMGMSFFACGGSDAEKKTQDSLDSVAKADSIAKAEAEAAAAAAADTLTAVADSLTAAADSVVAGN